MCVICCATVHRQPATLAVRVVDVETVERDRRRRYVHDAFNSVHVATADAICQPMRLTTTRTTFVGHVTTKDRKRIRGAVAGWMVQAILQSVLSSPGLLLFLFPI